MRKILAYLMAALMLLSGIAAQAEAAEPTPEASAEPILEEEEVVEPAEDPLADVLADPMAAMQAPLELPEITRVANYEELKIGTTTALSGSFFTEMWGNNATDIDARFLLHGYNLMRWEEGMGTYGMDPSVVSALVGTEDANGDRTYNVALYDDLYYSDGMPVTARDYAFSILLSMAPQVAEIGGQTTSSDYLVGAAAYKAGESDTLPSVRIISDHQFTVTVSADYLPFFYELALLNYNPYPIHVIAPGCIVADDGEGIYIRNMTEEELAAQNAELEAAAQRVADARAADAERIAAQLAELQAQLAAAEAESVPAEEGDNPNPGAEFVEGEEEPTATPEPTSTPEPTATPEPAADAEATATPEPAPTREPVVLPADGTPLFTAELLRETILDPETGYLSHPSVVSGPYELADYDAETHTADFLRNVMYKGDADGNIPTVERLVMKPVTNENMIAALASGEVDLINKAVEGDALNTGMALVAQSDELQVSNYTRSGYSFISFSCERPTVGSQAVRQAIAYCLDKDALVADYVGNYGLVVNGYYGLGQWMYQMVQGQIQAQPAEETPAEGEGAEGEAAAEGETATEGEAAEPEEEIVLSMDGIKTYPLDVAAAVALLEGDGWTLNREGEPFDPVEDDVRCKEIAEDEYLPLELKMIYPEGNAIGEVLQDNFITYLAQAGILLTAEPMPMNQLLDIYYRNVERDVDMIFLATNFATVFDPSATFNPADAYQGRANRTGIADEELYNLAVDMRRTEPGQVMEYCQKWVKFQERFSEVLPTIPIYSNVYFDFYASNLQNYLVSSNLSWGQAINAAYLSDAPEEIEVPVEEEEELGEGEMIFD